MPFHFVFCYMQNFKIMHAGSCRWFLGFPLHPYRLRNLADELTLKNCLDETPYFYPIWFNQMFSSPAMAPWPVWMNFEKLRGHQTPDPRLWMPLKYVKVGYYPKRERRFVCPQKMVNWSPNGGPEGHDDLYDDIWHDARTTMGEGGSGWSCQLNKRWLKAANKWDDLPDID